MAILEDLRAEVTVEVNGVTAVEYDAPFSAEATEENDGLVLRSQKYIESIDDAEFSIRITAEDRKGWLKAKSKHRYSFDVFVDGLDIRAELMDPSDNPFKLHVKGFEDDRSPGVARLRRFKFGTIMAIEDADDKRVRDDMEKGKSLGLIEVRVFKCIQNGTISTPARALEPRDLSIASKAIQGNALSHGMTLQAGGDEIEPRTYYDVTYPEDSDIATFTFRYGSKEALKQQLVIPRTPQPSPEPPAQLPLQPTGYDSLSQEEKDRLGRLKFEELQVMRSLQQRDVKLESDILTREIGAGIKREHGSSPSERASKMPRGKGRRETVDLTDD